MEADVKRFLYGSSRIWLWVNGPAVTVLLAVQAFGLPYSLSALLWVLLVALWHRQGPAADSDHAVLRQAMSS